MSNSELNPTLESILLAEVEERKKRVAASPVRLPFSRSAAERRASYWAAKQTVIDEHRAEAMRIVALQTAAGQKKRAAESALDEQLAQAQEQLRAELAASIDAELPPLLKAWIDSGSRADTIPLGRAVRAFQAREHEEIDNTSGRSELVAGLCRLFTESPSSFTGNAERLIGESMRDNTPGLERELRAAEELKFARRYTRR